MSSFEVKARRLVIEPHDNADALEIAKIDGYVAVVQKGLYETGGLAIYVPEQAVVPEEILKRSGFWDEEKGKGLLAGPKGDRVKAIRLRGVLSQGILLNMTRLGLLYVWPDGTSREGVEYGHILGITKYEPPIPTHLSGEVINGSTIRSYTDIENIKKFPGVIGQDEHVFATEKLHGSCCIVHLDESHDLYVSSKGLASKGLALVDTKDEHGRSTNAYWRSIEPYDLHNKLSEFMGLMELIGVSSVTLYGETIGVQDLMYGLSKGSVDFRAFDLAIDGEYVDYEWFCSLMAEMEIPVVQTIWYGPASDVERLTEGHELLSGSFEHVREGVVVRPIKERRDDTLGRVILKSINPDYLLRKGNTTEFE